MGVERLKAHIDFPSSEGFRLTNAYRQKSFKSFRGLYVNLETFKEASSTKGLDFYMVVHSDDSRKFRYEVWAKVSSGGYQHPLFGSVGPCEVVSRFQHHSPTTIDVNIYRQKK